MKKIDPVVIKETKYIAYFVIILSIAMEAVFLILRKWDVTVLLGNILSASAAVLNFLFMGITVQKAVMKDEKDAKTAVKASQSLRTFFLFAVAAIGALVPIFNIWSSLIPLLFPRIAIMFRPLFDKE
ncbi:MAG: hypothetical protein J6C16_02365 [Clostridia bacterium]|nr:hypothetical protein [Clostridia bacterium]